MHDESNLAIMIKTDLFFPLVSINLEIRKYAQIPFKASYKNGKSLLYNALFYFGVLVRVKKKCLSTNKK